MALKIQDIPDTEMIQPGGRACPGCGMLLAYRHILKAMGEKTVAVVPACCLTVVHGFYPISSVNVSTINTAFAAAAATASGVVAGLKAEGREDYNVLVMAGDGVVGLEHLPDELRGSPGTPAGGLRAKMLAFERKIVQEVLERHGGNRTATAAELGITRQGLVAKIRRLGLGGNDGLKPRLGRTISERGNPRGGVGVQVHGP